MCTLPTEKSYENDYANKHRLRVRLSPSNEWQLCRYYVGHLRVSGRLNKYNLILFEQTELGK